MAPPDKLARTLDDLLRRVRSLEQSTQLSHSSVDDGKGGQVNVADGVRSAAAALDEAQRARALADGKIVAFYRDVAPDPAVEVVDYGDQWYDTGNGNAQSWYDGTQWVPLPVGTAAIEPGAVVPELFGSGRLGAELTVADGALQSASYVEGSAGWRFSDEDAQVPTLNIVGDLGAATLTAGQITLAGDDLASDLITPMPQGLEAYASLASGTHTGDIAGTETALFLYNMGSVRAGRVYRVVLHGHLQGTVVADAFDFRVRYTVDGTTPTTASGVMGTSLTRVTMPGTTSAPFLIAFYYAPSSDYDTLRMALTLVRASGTGTAFVYQTDPARALEWAVEDCGLYAGTAAVLSQRSKATAGGTTPPPDPDPVATYTRSWSATWSRSFDSDGGTRQGDDTPDAYQGYYSGTHGDTRSLVGFDYSAIASALAGATIKSVRLTFRVRHAYYNGGMTVKAGTHNYASKPTSWAGGNVQQNRASRSSCVAGSTYAVALPVAVGNELKAGTTRGIAFGPGGSTSRTFYGYLYGAGSGSSAPKLTITYTK